MCALTKNQIVTARIDGYSAEGAGILHTDGRAVFVPGAIRDELWEARILKVTASAVWGRGERLLEGSPHRRESDCAAFPRCGGCALRHMDYEEELNLKLRRVNDTLERIGGTKLRIETILPAGTDARKRRKVIFNVGERTAGPSRAFTGPGLTTLFPRRTAPP